MWQNERREVLLGKMEHRQGLRTREPSLLAGATVQRRGSLRKRPADQIPHYFFFFLSISMMADVINYFLCVYVSFVEHSDGVVAFLRNCSCKYVVLCNLGKAGLLFYHQMPRVMLHFPRRISTSSQ